MVRGRAPRTLMHLMIPVAGALVTMWVMLEASGLAQTVGALWLLAGVALYAARRQ